MKTIYLIERYVINRKTEEWTEITHMRFDVRQKALFIKDVKNKGFEYNRKEKAYILRCNPIESLFDRALIIKPFII